MSRPRFIGLLLALATLAVYLPVVRNGFIVYDDGDYMTQNKMVQAGWTLAGVKWAFTTIHWANWHPLTWLSLMTDCELFGLNAAGSHLVNALFHTANTVLVFALWLKLFDRRIDAKAGASPNRPDPFWPAAFMAALFAVHPLHVESVAWVAERKDVLSTFFGLLTLVCYAGYANRGGARRTAAYWLALFFFVCGLMSKPMLVTLPFVMLLLDYWPLERWGVLTFRQLLVEKIPFFFLTAVSCVVTYVAQSRGAVQSLATVPLAYRLENAPVAVAAYLGKTFWPSRLAVIYPMPHLITPLEFLACAAILGFITVIVCLERKRMPFLPVGWFWFLGTLVPVIGLVKVGDAAMADRYMYIPSIGIFAMIAFGAQKLSQHFALPRWVGPVAAALVLGALAPVTERQIGFWRDDESLFRHAMRVTTDNVDAMINYGVALEDNGKPMQAVAQYQRAEALAPLSYMACADLGNLLYYRGDTNGALEQYTRAVQLNPQLWTLRDGLGNALAGVGRFAEATNQFYQAMRLDPASAAPHFYLGITLAAHRDFAGATNAFSEAIRLAPDDPVPLVEWAKALLQQGRDAEAVAELHQALQLDPDNFQTLAFLARVLAADEHGEVRDGAAALTLAQRASALTEGAQPLVQDVLGMAYAESGQFADAAVTASNAIQLATAAGMRPETIAAMQERWQLYQEHQPWRESFLNGTK